jgi:hypothetical protein
MKRADEMDIITILVMKFCEGKLLILLRYKFLKLTEVLADIGSSVFLNLSNILSWSLESSWNCCIM